MSNVDWAKQLQGGWAMSKKAYSPVNNLQKTGETGARAGGCDAADRCDYDNHGANFAADFLQMQRAPVDYSS